MDTKIPCKCGFDLSTLPMTLPHAHPARISATQDGEVFCPVCGTSHKNLMKGRGFFLRQTRDSEGRILSTRWRYWSEAAPQARTSQGPSPVPLGALHIQFGEEAEPIRPGEVLYPQVSRFIHREGGEVTAKIPALPVRPEYLDCLDPDALRRIRSGDIELQARIIEKNGKRVYECVLPLRGLPASAWEKKSIPLGPDVEGVFLRHWPNIDDLRWRYHVVSLGFDEVKGRSEVAQGWDVQALVPEVSRNNEQRLEENEVILYAYKLPAPDVKDPERRVFSLAIEGREHAQENRPLHQGRPAWIAVSVGGSGGVFSLPPGREMPAVPVEFGLDFGTSNTVVATQLPGQAEPDTVAPGDTTRWIFGRIDIRLDPDDLWPGAPWSGQHNDLLPSELLLREGSWHEYNGRAQDVSRLKLGVDVGVPLMMAQPQRDAGRSRLRPLSLLSDFKWQRALRGQGLEGLAQEAWRVQARFLEAGMLTAVAAQVRATGRYPSSVAVWYSYPPAFKDKDKEQLQNACGDVDSPHVAAASLRIQSVLGLPQPAAFNKGPDEASAAVVAPDPNREFAVFVDIGGGSLEVVIRDEYVPKNREGHGGLEHVVTSRSLYFGGGVYLRSLVSSREKGCMMSGIDYAQLASRVRRFGSGADFIGAPELFSAQRVKTAQLRAQVFGEAIADYVARTLAGLCLEHGYQHGHESEPKPKRRLNLTRNRLFYWDGTRWKLGGGHGDQRRVKFSIFLLGNGWNTVEIAVPEGANQTVEKFFAGRVQSRLKAILRQEQALAQRITDGTVSLAKGLTLDIECPQIVRKGNSGVAKHRKAVVATQVLKQKAPAGNVGDEMKRGVLGFEVTLGLRKVEWYRPYGPPQVAEINNLDPARTSRQSVLGTHREGDTLERGPGPDTPMSEQGGPPSLSPAFSPREWYLASQRREAKGQWDLEGLVRELKGQADAGDWLLWKKGELPTWTPVRSVAAVWDRVKPMELWAVALGTRQLGAGLDLEAARRAMLGSGQPHECKVWRKEFGRAWKSVRDVSEFVSALPDDGPPPLGDDGPPPLGDDGPPPWAGREGSEGGSVMEQPPVLDDWNGYVFPEGSLSTQDQRMMVRDPLAPPESDVYTPARLDTPQDRIPNTMMNTLVAVTEQLRDPHATAKFALSGSDVNHDDVNWFLFSPYEVFLEQVLAERLKTVEIGELK